MIINPYKSLGVSDDAPLDVCKKAYRKLCAKYHPDNGGDTDKFKEVNDAWDLISRGNFVKPVIMQRGLSHTDLFNFYRV